MDPSQSCQHLYTATAYPHYFTLLGSLAVMYEKINYITGELLELLRVHRNFKVSAPGSEL